MFETLFGAEMPLAVRFFLAFLIVLGLIGATAWAIRRFGSGRLGNSSSRGRQPRLAVIDYASVDARRRLILVRRDNVEHLLMIGGPTDVVVEPNIVRASAAPREMSAPRPPNALESLPRAIPLPDNGSGGSWPLQPEPAGTPRPAPRNEIEEPAAWPVQPPAETAPRPQRDTLAALADELSVRPTPPAQPRSRTPGGPRPLGIEQRLEQRSEPRVEQRSEPRVEQRSEPRMDQRPEPRIEQRLEARPEPRPEPRVPATQPAAAEGDQSLAEMAHRLEAALRKPNATADSRDPRASRPPAVTARPAPSSEDQPADDAAATPQPPRAVRPADPKPQRSDAKSGQGKALYDSLEQEMASLLGRPTNKN